MYMDLILEFFTTWILIILFAFVLEAIRIPFNYYDWAIVGGFLWWLIYYYTTHVCPEGQPFPHIDSLHAGLCDKNLSIVNFHPWERKIYYGMALLTIAAQVVPNYTRGYEADRHLNHIKKNKLWNPILFHICTSIPIVVLSGYLSIQGEYSSTLRYTLMTIDLLHHVSIHRLLKNHDGIWSLRGGNLNGAIGKIMTMMLVDGNQDFADVIFVSTLGFMGTRIFAFSVYLMMYFNVQPGHHSLVYEEWYSIGVYMAQGVIQSRVWCYIKPAMWISAVYSAVMNYHPLWSTKYRWTFIFYCSFMSTIGTMLPTVPSFLMHTMFAMSFFWTPYFNREPLATTFKDTTPEDKLVRRMSVERKSVFNKY